MPALRHSGKAVNITIK